MQHSIQTIEKTQNEQTICNELARCVEHVKQKYEYTSGNYITTESEVGKVNGVNRIKKNLERVLMELQVKLIEQVNK